MNENTNRSNSIEGVAGPQPDVLIGGAPEKGVWPTVALLQRKTVAAAVVLVVGG